MDIIVNEFSNIIIEAGSDHVRKIKSVKILKGATIGMTMIVILKELNL